MPAAAVICSSVMSSTKSCPSAMYASWKAGMGTIVRPAMRVSENQVVGFLPAASAVTTASSENPSMSTAIASASIDTPVPDPSMIPSIAADACGFERMTAPRKRHMPVASSRHASSIRPTVTTSLVVPPWVPTTSRRSGYGRGREEMAPSRKPRPSPVSMPSGARTPWTGISVMGSSSSSSSSSASYSSAGMPGSCAAASAVMVSDTTPPMGYSV